MERRSAMTRRVAPATNGPAPRVRSSAHHAEEASNPKTAPAGSARLIAAAANVMVACAAPTAFHTSGTVPAGTADSYVRAGVRARARSARATSNPPWVNVSRPGTPDSHQIATSAVTQMASMTPVRPSGFTAVRKRGDSTRLIGPLVLRQSVQVAEAFGRQFP